MRHLLFVADQIGVGRPSRRSRRAPRRDGRSLLHVHRKLRRRRSRRRSRRAPGLAALQRRPASALFVARLAERATPLRAAAPQGLDRPVIARARRRAARRASGSAPGASSKQVAGRALAASARATIAVVPSPIIPCTGVVRQLSGTRLSSAQRDCEPPRRDRETATSVPSRFENHRVPFMFLKTIFDLADLVALPRLANLQDAATRQPEGWRKMSPDAPTLCHPFRNVEGARSDDHDSAPTAAISLAAAIALGMKSDLQSHAALAGGR